MLCGRTEASVVVTKSRPLLLMLAWAATVAFVVGIYFCFRGAEEEVVAETNPALPDSSPSDAAERLSNVKTKVIEGLVDADGSGTASADEVESSTVDSEDVEDIVEEYTQEELDSMRYAYKKIEPRYSELAPVIFDSMLAEQSHNREWTMETKDGMVELLQQEQFRGTLLNTVDCYETLCRIVVTSDSEEDYRVLALRGPGSGPLSVSSHGSRTVLDDGTIQTRVYISRRTDGSPFVEVKDRMLAYIENEESAAM